jgi:hypothetical protein
MITLYRIVDFHTETVVCEGMTEQEAYETHAQLSLDLWDRLYVESYTVSSVRGLGRDPDLH